MKKNGRKPLNTKKTIGTLEKTSENLWPTCKTRGKLEKQLKTFDQHEKQEKLEKQLKLLKTWKSTFSDRSKQRNS